jgi:hypothetical protein
MVPQWAKGIGYRSSRSNLTNLYQRENGSTFRKKMSNAIRGVYYDLCLLFSRLPAYSSNVKVRSRRHSPKRNVSTQSGSLSRMEICRVITASEARIILSWATKNVEERTPSHLMRTFHPKLSTWLTFGQPEGSWLLRTYWVIDAALLLQIGRSKHNITAFKAWNVSVGSMLHFRHQKAGSRMYRRWRVVRTSDAK